MALDLENLNNQFLQSKNLFQDPIYQWVWRTNPFISLFDRKEFNEQDGLVPEVVTTTGELPTAYPDLDNLTVSNGSGSAACDIEATEVRFGNIRRTYQLEVDAARSPIFCLTDLQFGWQAAQMARNAQQMLGQYATVRWSDWYRMKNISMINTKVATLAAGAIDTGEDSTTGFTGVDTPTTAISWDHLNPLYDELLRNGGELHAPGMSEGMPVFTLAVGPGIKRLLYQTDTKVRDTVNWIDAGNRVAQNFQALGINTSINGFAPLLDKFPVRFAADGVTKIYPTINVAASGGWKFAKNPDYATVANGGLAVYEVVSVLCRDIYEVRPRPTGTTQYGMQGFNPINYVGDIQWINNRTFGGVNDQGNKGYYRMDFQMAAKPVRPEIGYTILTLAVD